ncbi:MAG: hypothetical protein AAGD33_16125 [Actinomycetota bacterium]
MTEASGDQAGREPREPERSDSSPGAVDPLLVDPAVPTGQTGAIERPGDDRPAWLVPILAVVLIGFVAVLAAVAAQRDDTGDETDAGGADAALTEPADFQPDETSVSSDAVEVSAPSNGDTTDPADTVPDVASTVDLPTGSGAIVVGGTESMIVSACEDHRPFAPADESVRTSTYAFRDGDGSLQLISRRVEPDGPGGSDASVVEWVGRGLTAIAAGGDPVGPFTVDLSDPSDSGSDGSDVVVAISVDPAESTGLGCDSLVVTNEPGQFAFPTARVVMAACSEAADTGADVVGVLSSGGRFEVRPTAASDAEAADTPSVVELRIVDPRIIDGEEVEYVDLAADAFVDSDQLSFSGLVELAGSVDGAPASLDATVDVRAGRLPACGDTGP